jgi:hypothetical protein
METCKTCCHWIPRPKYNNPKNLPFPNLNDLEPLPPEWGKCSLIVGPLEWTHNDNFSTMTLHADGCECVRTWAETGRDFGCIHHNPKG